MIGSFTRGNLILAAMTQTSTQVLYKDNIAGVSCAPGWDDRGEAGVKWRAGVRWEARGSEWEAGD